MDVVKCPKCDRELLTSLPIVKATVKCKACGLVFVGTSRPWKSAGGPKAAEEVDSSEAADMAALAAATRAAKAPARTYARPRKRQSAWMTVIVIIGLLAIGAGVFAFMRLGNTVLYIEKDLKGNVVFEGRISKEEAVRRKAEHDKAAIAEEAAPRIIYVAAAAGENAGAGGANAGPPIVNDANVTLKQWNRIGGLNEGDTGGIGGELVNQYDSPIQKLWPVLTLLDANDKELGQLAPLPISLIPAKSTVMFWAPLEGVADAGQIKTVKLSARARVASSGAYCAEAKVDKVELKVGAIVISGTATNSNARNLARAWIQCDLFTAGGVLVASPKGELDPSARRFIPAGKSARFQIECKAPDFEGDPATLRPQARVAGLLTDAEKPAADDAAQAEPGGDFDIPAPTFGKPDVQEEPGAAVAPAEPNAAPAEPKAASQPSQSDVGDFPDRGGGQPTGADAEQR